MPSAFGQSVECVELMYYPIVSLDDPCIKWDCWLKPKRIQKVFGLLMSWVLMMFSLSSLAIWCHHAIAIDFSVPASIGGNQFMGLWSTTVELNQSWYTHWPRLAKPIPARHGISPPDCGQQKNDPTGGGSTELQQFGGKKTWKTWKNLTPSTFTPGSWTWYSFGGNATWRIQRFSLKKWMVPHGTCIWLVTGKQKCWIDRSPHLLLQSSGSLAEHAASPRTVRCFMRVSSIKLVQTGIIRYDKEYRRV